MFSLKQEAFKTNLDLRNLAGKKSTVRSSHHYKLIFCFTIYKDTFVLLVEILCLKTTFSKSLRKVGVARGG